MELYENKLLKAIFINPTIFLSNQDLFDIKELFQNKFNKFIFQNYLEYFNKYGAPPSEITLLDKLKIEISNEMQQKIVVDHFNINIVPNQIDEAELRYIEDRIKHQAKERIIFDTSNKLEKLSSQDLEKTLVTLHQLSITEKKFEIINLWDEVENIEREVITTNLELIDEFGVAKGELGLLLAGTGVGKSVFLTYLANNLMLGGHKILHIVFEGNKNQYLKAHRIKLNNPTSEELKEGEIFQNLKLIKMMSNQTSTQDIEDLIKSCIKDEFIPDVLVIDYLDCIVLNNRNEIWKNDIQIINEMEHLAQKYQIVIWSAVQANRSGISKELTLENTSGSISKVQKATLVLSLTRNEYQEETNTADVRVLKNRTGQKRASMNCPWNPKTMQIDLPIQDVTL
jgi:archaellum biogenesis ATPase FlaH